MPPKIKKIYYRLPLFVRRLILRAYEDYQRRRVSRELGIAILPAKKKLRTNAKLRVLFYYVFGLSHGGVSKMMQGFAKYLDPEKFEVYFMYSAKRQAITGSSGREDSRKFYLENTHVRLIEHSYDSIDSRYPHIIRNMKPSLDEILEEKNIDILITTGSGYAEFPFIMVRQIPIIQFNIFGSPAMQRNIVKHLCISDEVADKVLHVTEPRRVETFYIPSEPPPPGSYEDGQNLRRRLGLKSGHVVFGRIGRAVDGIFDPIGILAFKEVVKDNPEAHYLIMSPPPMLERLVADEHIPNIHLLPVSGDDKDIWAFHNAIDVLGHFRLDGESFGLNIVESMLCGKPILSHKSHYWNAHLEYLENSFSRVAEVDDVNQYAEYMRYFINLSPEERKRMGEMARQKAERLFLIKNNIGKFEAIISQAVKY